jgi:hypothetical protein
MVRATGKLKPGKSDSTPGAKGALAEVYKALAGIVLRPAGALHYVR